MGLLKMDLLVSGFSHQEDGNVDMDCFVTMETINHAGISTSDFIEMDLSTSLITALDHVFGISDDEDYTDEELMSSHECLSLIRNKAESLITLIEERGEMRGEANG